MLGKRKREVAVATRQSQRTHEEESPPAPDDGERDVFRKYFESTFEPLPESQTAVPSFREDEAEEDVVGAEEESEWEGLSDTDAESAQPSATVEVVVHQTSLAGREEDEDELQRARYKTFMSSRPPKDTELAPKKNLGKQTEEDDASEVMNLKHDLDLQRLLKESHLLEQAKTSSTPGSHRHRAVDMRMQSLGSRGSLFHQEKMPLAHRKGILARSSSREVMRRKEAQENGIILEKASRKAKPYGTRRENGVDAPAVGKFRGGTLKLSKKDVMDIQGAGPSRGRGKRGR